MSTVDGQADADGKRVRAPWPVGQEVQFFVAGFAPVPKGSMRAFMPKGFARPIITDSKGKALVAYQTAIGREARLAVDRRGLPCALRQPFVLTLAFFFARPDGHLDKLGNVKASAPSAPDVKPDIDKCMRSVLDAITGVIVDDDSRVVRVVVEKFYADGKHPVGTWITARVRPSTVGQDAAARQLTMEQTK